jgi:hypothetical protein
MPLVKTFQHKNLNGNFQMLKLDMTEKIFYPTQEGVSSETPIFCNCDGVFNANKYCISKVNSGW